MPGDSGVQQAERFGEQTNSIPESGLNVFFPRSQNGVSDESGLIGISEFMEVKLGQMQSFTHSEDPVVERARNGQVGAVGTAEEKFAVAICKSLSIRLLSRQVQFAR